MFDELYRKSGQILIPTGEYAAGLAVTEEHEVRYMMQESTYRDETGALQCETVIFCKGYEEPIPAGSRFIDCDGNAYDIRASRLLFDHFANAFEVNKLTVAR